MNWFSLPLPSLRIAFRHAPLGLDRLRLGTIKKISKNQRSLAPPKGAQRPSPPFQPTLRSECRGCLQTMPSREEEGRRPKGDLGGLSISFYLVRRGGSSAACFSLSVAEGNRPNDRPRKSSSSLVIAWSIIRHLLRRLRKAKTSNTSISAFSVRSHTRACAFCPIFFGSALGFHYLCPLKE